MADTPRLDEISASEQQHLASLAGWLDLGVRHLNRDTIRAVAYLGEVCAQNPDEWIPFYLLAQYDLKCWTSNSRHHIGLALLAASRAHTLASSDARTAFGFATALRMAAYTGRELHAASQVPPSALHNVPTFLPVKTQGTVAALEVSPIKALTQALGYFHLTSDLGLHTNDAGLVEESIRAVRSEIEDPEFLKWRISLGPAALRQQKR